MKKKPKSGSGKIDFISNRLNKYSIRKFTVGTASILVGATLLFGLADEAKASEQTSENSVLAQSKNNVNDGENSEISIESPSLSTEKPSLKDGTVDRQTEEKAPEAESTEEVSTEKAPEAQTTEEASTEKAPEAEATEEA
ncbi:YSIRK-type signal peptide-containing protein, partial [Mammaliicoccus sciuri]|uniref:YSIRK-type signal peptide-containing protein n=1 Tax=Mammaliicoccus sciuri TaxID=1296 RepID=UPI0037CA53EB